MKIKKWVITYCVILTSLFSFVLLDTFVVPKPVVSVQASSVETSNALSTSGNNTTSETSVNTELAQSITVSTDVDTSEAEDTTESGTDATVEPIITANSYEDENIKITIDTVRKYNSTLYIADIQVSDINYLKTAFAQDTYGRNLKAATSTIAESNNAIFAINGDFYGFRDKGFVLRNGVLYRDTARNTNSDDALAIDVDGNFSILDESETDLASISSSLLNVFSFGPALIDNGEILVDSSSEVDQSKTSNPRTAIGQISELHYVIIVSDGRTSESEGLTLLELAETFKELGCTTAYNLDGGGSSTMYFNGEIVNIPTDGRKLGERSVSDIVYIGYE